MARKQLLGGAMLLIWALVSSGQSIPIAGDSVQTKNSELFYSRHQSAPIIRDVAHPMYFDECDTLCCIGEHPGWLVGTYRLTQDKSTLFGDLKLCDNGHFFLNNPFIPSASTTGHWDFTDDGFLVINSGKKMLQVEESYDSSRSEQYYTLCVKRVISSKNEIYKDEPNCIIYSITELGDTIESIPDTLGLVHIPKSVRLLEIFVMAGEFMSKDNYMIETNHYKVEDPERSNYIVLNCAVRRHFDRERWIVDENHGIHALKSNGRYYNDYPLQRKDN